MLDGKDRIIRLKDATDVNTSDFVKKTDSTNLKSDVDKLDIDNMY